MLLRRLRSHIVQQRRGHTYPHQHRRARGARRQGADLHTREKTTRAGERKTREDVDRQPRVMTPPTRPPTPVCDGHTGGKVKAQLHAHTRTHIEASHSKDRERVRRGRKDDTCHGADVRARTRQHAGAQQPPLPSPLTHELVYTRQERDVCPRDEHDAVGAAGDGYVPLCVRGCCVDMCLCR